MLLNQASVLHGTARYDTMCKKTTH